jgi:hypothetical protein
MNQFKLTHVLGLAVLAGLCVALSGCKVVGGGSKAAAWNLTITKATPATIEVDLVGVTPLDKTSLEGYPVDKYFSANDPRRTGLKVDRDRLTRVLQSNEPWLIDRKDPIWAGWRERGVTELLVLARLPGRFEGGPNDPRRLFIPLQKGKWDAQGSTLEVEIQDTLIRVMTRQKQ